MTEARRKRVRLLQKYVINPPLKALTFAGKLPGHVLLETKGRKTGKPRRTIVGVQREGSTLWIVAEQGRYAGYVANIAAEPKIRVRLDGRWADANAVVLDDDDADARLASFDDQKHAGMVRKFGTSLLTVRVDLHLP
ncbi:deazaflavin-dependent oxidoreductase, nitroreductase family [Amycolatopsis xylanica]|uniref:Deazaflavin-dependent oxidoreductase, nitroreductase family n=1 Tax=Amycolatopsis xylanica TaxID=589385 RepID=A0A1H3RZ63_9PSEU|nr:nitroreductase/quinone reductase family protein [Amycolatopsis xylanica]SDZ30541.1 deazaflavin-dependent oxidoreductase, nitroreductase family [Amycolatopsis xylanica]